MSRQIAKWVVAALCCQFAALAWVFPITQLWSQDPNLHVDGPFHWYQIALARELWLHDRQLVGYDPLFAAGHVGGIPFNASAKLPALLAAIWPDLFSPATAQKAYLFVCGMLVPLAVPLAMRELRADAVSSIAASSLALAAYWISSLRWYDTAGMASFVFGAYLAVPFIAMCLRAITGDFRLLRIVAIGIVSLVGFLNHPLFFVQVLACAGPAMIWFRNQVRWRNVVWLSLLITMSACLPNLPWLVPTFSLPGWSGNSMSPFQKAVDPGMIWQEAIGLIGQNARGSLLNPLLWCSTVLAVAIGSADARRHSVLFAAAAALLIVVAAFGGTIGAVATLQPNRFSSVAYLLLCIPAGYGVAAVVNRIADSNRLRLWPGLPVAAIGVIAAGLLVRELALEISHQSRPGHGAQPPYVRGEGPITHELLSWIHANTTADARILFETSSGRIHDGGHIAGYLAARSQRAFVGGPYVYMHAAGYWDGQLGFRDIASLSDTELVKFIDQYNIGWIVVYHPKSTQVWARVSGVRPAGTIGPLHLFAVDRKHSFVLEGSADSVAAKWNRIELRGVSPTGVTLSYHWVEGLVSDPATELLPKFVPGNNQPFIDLPAPPSELTIRYR